MTPLHATGAITEEEITKFETPMVREQFGLKGDIKSGEINKFMLSSSTKLPVSSQDEALSSEIRLNQSSGQKPKITSKSQRNRPKSER